MEEPKEAIGRERLVRCVASNQRLSLAESTITHFTTDKITAESKHRQPSAIKDSAQFLKWEGMLSLGGGLPSSDYFPFGSYSIKAPTLGHFSEEDTERSGVFLSSGKHDMQDQKSFFDIATAFNYGQGCGSVQLLRFLIEHTVLKSPDCNSPRLSVFKLTRSRKSSTTPRTRIGNAQ